MVRKRLDEIEKRWQDVVSRSSTRETQMKELLELVEEYSNVDKEFSAWLNEAEEKLVACAALADDKDAVERQQEILEVEKS